MANPPSSANQSLRITQNILDQHNIELYKSEAATSSIPWHCSDITDPDIPNHVEQLADSINQIFQTVPNLNRIIREALAKKGVDKTKEMRLHLSVVRGRITATAEGQSVTIDRIPGRADEFILNETNRIYNTCIARHPHMHRTPVGERTDQIGRDCIHCHPPTAAHDLRNRVRAEGGDDHSIQSTEDFSLELRAASAQNDRQEFINRLQMNNIHALQTQLRTQEEVHQAQLAENEEQITTLQEQLHTSAATVSTLERELANERNKRAGDQERIQRLEGELGKASANYDDILMELDELREENQQLYAQNQALHEALREADENHTAYMTEEAELHDTQIQELLDQLQQAGVRNSDLEREIGHLRASNDGLRKAVQTNQNKIGEFQKKYRQALDERNRLEKNLRKIIANQALELTEKTDQIDQLQDALSDRDQDISYLNTQIRQLQNQYHTSLQDLANQYSSNLEKIQQAAKAEIEQRNQQIADLNDKLKDALNREASQISKNTRLEENLTKLQTSTADERGRLENIIADQLKLIDRLTQDLGRTQDIIRDRDATIDRFQNLDRELEHDLANQTITTDDLEEQLGIWKAEFEKLQDENAALSLKLSELENKLKKTTGDAATALEIQRSLMQEALDAKDSELNEAQNQIALLSRDNAAIAAREQEQMEALNDLREQAALQAEQIDILKEDNTAKQAEIAHLEQRLSERSEEIQELKESHKKQIKQLNNEISGLNAQKTAANKELETLKPQLDELRRTVTSQQDHIDKLTVDLAREQEAHRLKSQTLEKTQQNLKSTQKELDESKARERELELTQNELRSLQNMLEADNTNIRQDLGRALKELDRHTRDLQEASEKLEHHDRTIQDLKKETLRLKGVDAELGRVKDQLRKEETQRAAVEKEVAELKLQIKQLQEINRSLDNHLKESTEKLAANKPRLQEALRLLFKERQRNADLESQLAAQADRIAALEASNTELQNQLKESQSALTEQKGIVSQLEKEKANIAEELRTTQATILRQEKELANNATKLATIASQQSEKEAAEQVLQNRQIELVEQNRQLTDQLKQSRAAEKTTLQKLQAAEKALATALATNQELVAENAKLKERLSLAENIENQLIKIGEEKSNELETAKAQLKRLQTQESRHSKHIQDLTGQLERQKASNEALQRANQQLMDRHTAYDQERQLLATQLKTAHSQIYALEGKIAQLAESKVAEIQKVESELVEANLKRSELEEELKATNDRLAQIELLKNGLSSSLENANETIRSISNRLQIAKNALAAAKDENVALNEQIIALGSALLDAKQELTRHIKLVTELKDTIHSKQTELDSLKGKKGADDQEIQSLKNELDDLQKEYNKLTEKKGSVAAQLQRAIDENRTARQEIGSLRAQITQLQQDKQDASEDAQREVKRIASQLQRTKETHAEDFAELTIENSEHKELITQLETALTNEKASARALRLELEGKGAELNLANKEIARLKNQIVTLENRAAEAEIALEAKQSALTLSDLALHTLRSSGTATSAELSEAQMQIRRLEAQVAALNKEVEESRQEAADAKTDFENRGKALHSKITHLENEYLALQEKSNVDLKQHQAKIDELETQLSKYTNLDAANNAKIQHLENQLAQRDQQIRELEAAHRSTLDLKDRNIDRLETQVLEQSQTIDNLQNELARLREINKDLTAARTASENDKNPLLERVTALTNQVTELEGQLLSIRREKATTDAEKRKIETDKIDLEKRFAKANETIGRLEGLNERQRTDLATARNNLAEVRREKLELGKEEAKLKEKLREAETNIQFLKTQLAEVRDQKATLESSYKSQIDDLNRRLAKTGENSIEEARLLEELKTQKAQQDEIVQNLEARETSLTNELQQLEANRVADHQAVERALENATKKGRTLDDDETELLEQIDAAKKLEERNQTELGKLLASYHRKALQLELLSKLQDKDLDAIIAHQKGILEFNTWASKQLNLKGAGPYTPPELRTRGAGAMIGSPSRPTYPSTPSTPK